MNLMDLFIKVGVDDQASSGIEKISATTIAAGQLMADAISAATEKVVELGKKAVESYADYEQLVGGIETLFKESSGQVQEYASEAYKTAGLSANEYMETVTSFSASLLQATGRGAQTNLEELEGYLKAEYEATKETYSAEYEARKETLDAEYKATKEAYNAEYKAAQEAYDAEYDALKAAQEAEIAAYTAAADAKIAAIDKSEKEAIAKAKQEKKDTLAAMKDGNKKELTELKNANKKKLEEQKNANSKLLEEQKAANSKELEELKDSNSKKLNEQKSAISDQVKAAEDANMVSVTTLESQEKAAELANQAIIDMSDNANKMGTSMESIQNAYQGFAKSNYTMLDNLKLGYGGTKEEMERLIADAAKLSDTVDAQSLAFDNVVQAIHVVQTELGITGTTALEAGATISGSIGSMKAAWENLVVGMADENANIEDLFRKLVVSIAGDGTETNKGVIGNLLPRIEQIFKGIRAVVEEAAPYIAEGATKIIEKITSWLSDPNELSRLLTAAENIVLKLGGYISEVAPKLVTSAISLVTNLIDSLSNSENSAKIFEGALDLVVELGTSIAREAPKLIDSAASLVTHLIEYLLNPENAAKILAGALKLVLELGAGIIKSAGSIAAAMEELRANIIAQLFETDWKQVGIDLLTDLWDGLKDLWPSLEQWLTTVGERILAAFTNTIAAVKSLFTEKEEPKSVAKTPETTKSALSQSWTTSTSGLSASQSAQNQFENAIANITAGESVIGQSSNAIANSFAGNGVPAGEVYNVSLDVDGETLANVLLDPLNRTAKQKGMVAFA